ncbi:protein-glutamate O-methyltransferase CheR [Sporichthya brevicatena]|uniref:protein-glutamate O-methyltransferase n=1 Tax=Sporichthya brevicatena TaxID=171442 RepID=A0ABN1GDT1_9ACTN
MTSTTVTEASAADLKVVAQFVESRSAILCPEDKYYLFEARLRPVLRKHDLPGLTELAAALRKGPPPALAEAVIEAMTTNETSWFRDVHPFDAIRTGILPELIAARQSTRRLAVWSAACSTGQELYSLAMMLDLQFPEVAGWDVALHGTDINLEVLAQAKAARYSALEVNRGLPAQYLARYFEREGASYVLAERVRSRATFTQLNFVGPWPVLPRFDLVLCRNVLIYFDIEVRARIVRKIRDTLAPGGYLVLGSSETSVGDVDGFTRVVFGRTTVYRKEAR